MKISKVKNLLYVKCHYVHKERLKKVCECYFDKKIKWWVVIDFDKLTDNQLKEIKTIEKDSVIVFQEYLSNFDGFNTGYYY